MPEVTDDWVAENTGEFETVDEWTESIRERLVGRQAQPGPPDGDAGADRGAHRRWSTLEPPESMVDAEMQTRMQNIARQFQSQGIDLERLAVGHRPGPAAVLRGLPPAGDRGGQGRPRAACRRRRRGRSRSTTTSSRWSTPGWRCSSASKARDIRRMYEQNDAVPELIAQIRKSKATDWLLHHVEMVDHEGQPIDRDLVLGHTHDEHGGHDHDHDEHDHDDHDHDGHDHEHERRSTPRKAEDDE